MTGKRKPYAVLFTRTSASIRTRSLTHIINSLGKADIPVLRNELNERDAFKAIFAFGQTLDRLSASDVPNLNKARMNVYEFVEEVVQRLKEESVRNSDGSTVDVAGAA